MERTPLLLELHRLMAKYAFRPEKRLAQHFVIQPWAVEEVARELELKGKDRVLEIGAGTGFLTRELQKKCQVLALEKDPGLVEVLEGELSKENLEIVQGDFLDFKVPGDITRIVSFAPYSQSKEFALRLSGLSFERAVMVFQKEFADKLVAFPGFHNFLALSVLCQLSLKVELGKKLGSECFYPSPRTESVIVSFSPRKSLPLEGAHWDAFTRFLLEVFRYKHKNAKNALLQSSRFLVEEKKLAGFTHAVGGLELGEEKWMLLENEEMVEIFRELEGFLA